jgi:hypothetical protein
MLPGSQGGSETRFARADGITLLLVAALVTAGANSCGKTRSDSHPSTEGGSNGEGASGSAAGAGMVGAAAGNAARGGNASGGTGGQDLAGRLGFAGGGDSGGGDSESGGNGGISGASGAPYGGAGAGNCAELLQAANLEFWQALQENNHCEQDQDCARLTVVADCVGVCGVVASKLEADSLQAAASEACRSFDARGCMPPLIGCPAAGVSRCQLGICIEK